MNNVQREICLNLEFSGSQFPAYVPNTEIYRVNLRFQSECGNIRTGQSSEFGPFLCSDGSFRIQALLTRKSKRQVSILFALSHQ